jgi:DNA-binding MarR family transcriptional regulator
MQPIRAGILPTSGVLIKTGRYIPNWYTSEIISFVIISSDISMSDRTRNFGFLVKDIGRLYTKLFERRARDLNWSLSECKVLTYLQRNAGINQIKLAELTGVEPMSLVRILDRMEADGLIERRPDPSDRRARRLFLQDKAQRTLDQVWKLSDATRAQSLAGIQAEERQVLIDLLERIHHNLIDAQLDAPAQAPAANPVRARAAKRRRAAKSPANPRRPSTTR